MEEVQNNTPPKKDSAEQNEQDHLLPQDQNGMLQPNMIRPQPQQDLGSQSAQYAGIQQSDYKDISQSRTLNKTVRVDTQGGKSVAEWRSAVLFYLTKLAVEHDQLKYLSEEEKRNICCVDIGNHGWCCSTSDLKQSIVNFGLGINLYFRSTKSMMGAFFCFSLLIIPQVLLSIYSFQQSGQYVNSNPSTWLMATTIGAIGLNNKVCQLSQFQSIADIIRVDLSCNSGVIDYNRSFKVGMYNSSESNCLYISSSSLINPSSSLQQASSCQDQQSCSFLISMADFIYPENVTKAFVSANCKSADIDLSAFSVPYLYVPIIIASIDAGIVLLFIIFLLHLGMSEDSYYEKVQEQYPMLEYFSLQVSNIPSKQKLRKKAFQSQSHCMSEIKKYIEEQLKAQNQNIQIYDIQLSPTQEQIHNLIKLSNSLTSIAELSQEAVQVRRHLQRDLQASILQSRQFFEFANQSECMFMIDSLIQEIEILNHKQKVADLREIKKLIEKHWQTIDKCKEQQKKDMLEDVKYVWVTFKTIQDKQIAENIFRSSWSQWFSYACCFCCLSEATKDTYLYDQYKLQIKQAPNPDNINWMNLYYSAKNRFLRRQISLLFTLIFLIASFIFISFINDQKNQILDKYPNIDCNAIQYKNITDADLEAERNGNSSIKGYIQCFCSRHLSSYLSNSLSSFQQNICNTWFQSYTLQTALPYIASIILLAINIVIQYLFIFLSKTEKHQIVSDEYTSRIIKIFLAQFLNTGLILLLTNMDFNIKNNSNIPEAIKFLFGGKYGDIDAQWCQYVGIVLLLTLLINTVTFPIIMIIERIVQEFKKCFDNGHCFGLNCCCKDDDETKKRTFEEYKQLYQGPDFQMDLRYVQITTAVYVCFVYSAALPFLYLTCFLTLLFLHYLDKYGLYKWYRRPVNFNRGASVLLRQALWFVIFVHCGFAIYIYGSTNIFYETKVSITDSLIDSADATSNQFYSWVGRALQQANNLPLLALLAILVLMFVFWKPLSYCYKKFQKWRKRGQKYEINPQTAVITSYFQNSEIMEDYQVCQFLMGRDEISKQLYANKLQLLKSHLVKSPQAQELVDSQLAVSQNISQLPPRQLIKQSEPQQQEEQQQQQQQVQQQNVASLVQPLVLELKTVQNTQPQQSQYKLIGLRSYNILYNPALKGTFKDEWDQIKNIQL